jgi:tetratricopeptide (TPR) repeat protein
MKLRLNNIAKLIALFLLSFSPLFSIDDENDMLKAENYLQNGQFILAEKEFRSIVESDSSNATARTGLINSLLGRGQNEEAKKEALTALELCRPNEPFSLLLGQINFLDGNYYKSIHYYRNSLLGKEDKLAGLTGLGVSYSYLYYLKKADQYLNQALEIYKNYQPAQDALLALKNLPWYFTFSSDYYQEAANTFSLSNSLFMTRNIYTAKINYKHFKKDKTYRDAYCLGVGTLDSGINTGIEFTFLDGTYDLLYNAYGGLLKVEKEFLHSSGKATIGYAFAYFWYDVLSSIQNSFWLESSYYRTTLRLEISDIAQDYEVKNKDTNNLLYLASIEYRILKPLQLFAYSSLGAHEFYYSPLGYIVDNYEEPDHTYGGGIAYRIGQIDLKASVNNDDNNNLSYIFGFILHGSIKN